MNAFLTVVVIHFLAVASPGPDFLIVIKNSLTYSKKIGITTALGVALGLGVHSVYCLLGIGLLISKSILIYNTIKWTGALYLMYIGIKALTAKVQPAHISYEKQKKSITYMEAFRNGFLCNVLNPKATLFILALFTQVIDPATPLPIQILYGVYMSVATMTWFSFIASIFNISAVKSLFAKTQSLVERTMGVILIVLGLKVAFSGNK